MLSLETEFLSKEYDHINIESRQFNSNQKQSPKDGSHVYFTNMIDDKPDKNLAVDLASINSADVEE